MNSSHAAKPFKAPSFWWSLSDQEKYQYQCLQLALSVGVNKNQRNQRLSSFKKCIELVRRFAVKGDYRDLIRCYVCGIIWTNDGIAVNTYYLKHLIGKCKSSINGSLQKMGYNNNMSRADSANAMIQLFPTLKENLAEIRKWSIRRLGEPTKNTLSITSTKETKIQPLSITKDSQQEQLDFWDFDFQTDDFADPINFAPF